jgi:hypothetical protein
MRGLIFIRLWVGGGSSHAGHYFSLLCTSENNAMNERDLIKLEATIRTKMEDIKKQRVTLKDSGIGGLMNSLKKVDEALYEKILPVYKQMVADYNIFK